MSLRSSWDQRQFNSSSSLRITSDLKLQFKRYSEDVALPLEKLEQGLGPKILGAESKKRKKVGFSLQEPPAKKQKVKHMEIRKERPTVQSNVEMGYENYSMDSMSCESPSSIQDIQPGVVQTMSEVEMYYTTPYAMQDLSLEPFGKLAPSPPVSELNNLDKSKLVQIIETIRQTDPIRVEEAIGQTDKVILKDSELPNQFDWNERFQHSMDKIQSLNPNSSLSVQEEAYHTLVDLSTDFTYTVKTYARIIISEVYLPDSQKMIKPINIGGIAGGAKYSVQRILFKFAIDHKHIHKDESVAPKIAGHELKSLTQLLNCNEPGLRYPMMALVDYRGFRVIGMTMLPISGEHSLIHGSCDGAKSVRYHPLVAPKLQSLARKLNLAPHQVGDVLMHLPVDLEVHCGTNDLSYFSTDSDLYLLDFSRLFPPEAPEKHRKMDYLYKLLRPELVMQYKSSPLCSDAFSNFIKPSGFLQGPNRARKIAEEKNINSVVAEATTYLQSTLVRDVGIALCSLMVNERPYINIPNFFHSHGVNLRYLGQVRIFVSRTQKDKYWSSVILIEMVSRVIKDIIRNRLRSKMKEIKHPGEGAYRREVICLLNTLFGCTYDSDIFWNTTVFPKLVDKYYNSEFKSIGASLRKEINSIQLNDQDGRWILLQRVALVLGLQFENSSWISFQKDSARHLFSCEKPFEETDLAEMKGKVKCLDIVASANGFVLMTKSILAASSEEERKRLLSLAIHSFDSALESNPCNIVSLYNMADCLCLDGQMERAKEFYRKALLLDNHNPVALFKYACYKELAGQYDSAKKYYKLAIHAFPSYATCHLVLADLLHLQYGDYDKAEYHYKEVLRIDPGNASGLNNYAVFLIVVRKQIDKATLFFERAVAGDFNPSHVQNYAIFLSKVLGDDAQAKKYQTIFDNKVQSRGE